PACRYQKPNQEITSYSGGPGYSRADAVIIHANDHEIGVNTEYWYLYYTYGRNWRRGIQRLITPDSDGRRFDVVDINFPTGETSSIYFDITKCFGRRGGVVALATEHAAARAFASAWNRLDILALEPHLDDGVHYSSQDVFDELVGKNAVVEY